MTLDEKLAVLYADTDSNKLEVYKDMAIDAVRNYMNLDSTTTDDTIETTYTSALIQLIGNKIHYDDTDGVKSYTMSKTSVTYGDNKGFGITDDIKALLPPPFAKLTGDTSLEVPQVLIQ